MEARSAAKEQLGLLSMLLASFQATKRVQTAQLAATSRREGLQKQLGANSFVRPNSYQKAEAGLQEQNLWYLCGVVWQAGPRKPKNFDPVKQKFLQAQPVEIHGNCEHQGLD